MERGHLRTTRDGARITLVSTSGTINGAFTGDTTLTILAGTNTLVFRR